MNQPQNAKRLKEFKQAIDRRGLVMSALSCHGNPLHPDEKIALQHHAAFLDTVALAQRLDVNTFITFGGCPAGDPKSPRMERCRSGCSGG